MSILVTLGWIAILVGVILVICGYTVAPQAQHPGWAALILGVVLILIGYLVPYIATTSHPSDCTTTANC